MQTLNKIKAKLEKESFANVEAKAQIAEMAAKIAELQQLVELERTERIKLEYAVKTGSLPDDAKMGLSSSALFSAASALSGRTIVSDFTAPAPPPPPPPAFIAPPPPPPAGMPPPPCPIGGKGMTGGMPGFPGSAMRKTCVPQSVQPLKSFNWAKLPDNKVKGTVWTDIDEAKVHGNFSSICATWPVDEYQFFSIIEQCVRSS